jgi:ferredoxin
VPKIRFVCKFLSAPDQIVEGDASPGELLTQVAYRSGVVIQQSCGGTPSCTDCRIKVLSSLSSLSNPEGPEARLMGNVAHITRERLACQAHVLADLDVEVPDPAGYRKKKIQRK